MSYRDSSGRLTRNPYSFLQTTKKYKVKEIKPLSEEEILYLKFELNWAEKELNLGIDLDKIIIKYFKYYQQLNYPTETLINIKSIDLNYISQIYTIQLYSTNYSFKLKLYKFLREILKIYRENIETYNHLTFQLIYNRYRMYDHWRTLFI